ncbi:MAG: hypothetical protein J7549_09345 [Variovorax sp.]|nr:hypothetical protein [Variovorax sp.]
MRAIGIIGLLLALAVVGVLAKRQLAAVPAASAPAGDAREQSRQIEQQIKQSLEAAQQQRPMPDDH